MFYSDGFEEGLAIISKVHPHSPPLPIGCTIDSKNKIIIHAVFLMFVLRAASHD